MRPTILAGDRVFVRRSVYDLKIPFTRRVLVKRADPARADIVVFASPEDGKRLLKRIVAVPGDVVEIRAGRLYINQEAAIYEEADQEILTESGARAQSDLRVVSEVIDGHRHSILVGGTAASASFGPDKLPAEHYFVLGDNRPNSRD